jgi:hypothetical protein
MTMVGREGEGEAWDVVSWGGTMRLVPEWGSSSESSSHMSWYMLSLEAGGDMGEKDEWEGSGDGWR